MPNYRVPDETWKKALALYLTGLSIKATAEKVGCKTVTLQAHACRNGWQKLRQSQQNLATHKDEKGLIERQSEWNRRVGTLLDRRLTHLETTEFTKLKLGDLRTLTEITDMVDRVARRALNLDGGNQNGAGPQTVNFIQLKSMVESLPEPGAGQESKKPAVSGGEAPAIDVESESEG